MDDQILSQAKKRAERYWYEDGIWEIGFGLANILLSAFYTLSTSLQARGASMWLMLALQTGVIVGIFWLMGWLVKWLKAKITYPRTGYVAYRKLAPSKRARRVVQMMLVSGGVAALVGAVASMQTYANFTPIVIGMIFAAMLAYLGHRFDLLRLYALIPLVLALALVLAVLGGDETTALILFFGGFGILFSLSGGLALLLYLRRTSAAGTPGDYEPPAGNE